MYDDFVTLVEDIDCIAFLDEVCIHGRHQRGQDA